MTPRSFWTILIKILGIYIIFNALVAIPQFLFSLYEVGIQINAFPDAKIIYIQFGYSLTVVIIYGILLWLSIWKTDLIIDKLGLDKGYQDERFEFTMHRSTILKIVIMIIGGVMLINSFPLLCKYTFSYFEQVNEYKRFKESPQAGYIIIYFLQTVIGYFLLTCSRMVVNYIELKRKKPAANHIED